MGVPFGIERRAKKRRSDALVSPSSYAPLSERLRVRKRDVFACSPVSFPIVCERVDVRRR